MSCAPPGTAGKGAAWTRGVVGEVEFADQQHLDVTNGLLEQSCYIILFMIFDIAGMGSGVTKSHAKAGPKENRETNGEDANLEGK